MQPYYLVHL